MRLFTLLVILVLSLLLTDRIVAQGCVAIRGNSVSGPGLGNALSLDPGEINVQLGYRYFRSFRHFRGDMEEVHRLEEGTEVINRSHFVDIALSFGITDRLFANAVLPFVHHRRSSMYEHGGNPPNGLGERHETRSVGLADVRLGMGYWLFEPGVRNFNYSAALGVKLPTGKYDYSDLFYNQGDNKDQDEENVVDQSIQPGDGGLGLTLDLQAVHSFGPQFGLTGNVYYLFNIQNTNGILTRNRGSEFSCPDQFAVTLGGSFNTVSGMSAYLGGRIEGVPPNDLIGGSDGYRRPGYAVSVEPGIGYTGQHLALFLSVPVAIYRNRTRSNQDIQRTLETGIYRHGDAAFADYLINVGISYRFGKTHEEMMPETVPEQGTQD